MNIALWIIALCELVRLIQNTLQLVMMNSARKNDQFKRATDEFIKSLSKSDSEFVEDMLEKIKKGECK